MANKLVHNGEGSFFLDGTLDIDLLVEMMSSIIADRNKAASVNILILILNKWKNVKDSSQIHHYKDSVLKIINDNARKEVEN